jgi:hypothetical protein
MKRIALSKGLHVLIDDRDLDYLSQWKWTAAQSNKTYYAYRKTSRATGQRNVYMHRVVAERMGLHSRRVDHWDGNGLNNCRSNLRSASQSQNAMNREQPRSNSSGLKGVSRTPNGRWRARITVDWREKHLGTFDAPSDAAHAYDQAAMKCHGEFARLNTARRLVSGKT